MRTEKVSDVTLQYLENEETASGMYDWNYAVNKPTTRFYYDGQMPVKEDYAEIIPNEDPFYEVTR